MNAVSAATGDLGFRPCAPTNFRTEVFGDVFQRPSVHAWCLDPKTYGVIVEDESGRRGLLLPDLEGIKAAAEQVEIASRKAGIPAGSPVKLFRFRADRYSE